jgi:membrane associated rhomboid family serine protease
VANIQLVRVRVVKVGPVTVPVVLAALMGAILVLSIAGVAGARNGMPTLLEHGLLEVPAVWQGQVWRLVTFVLFELGPISLIFSFLVLTWFGADLVARWGTRRFLAVFFGLAAIAGAVTCLIGLGWQMVTLVPHAGSAPVLDGLVVAWGIFFKEREVRLWGVVRLTGRWLIVATIAGTVLYALYEGLAFFVPHFATELVTLLWLAGIQPWRDRRRRRRIAQAARGEAWSFQTWYERERRRRR